VVSFAGPRFRLKFAADSIEGDARKAWGRVLHIGGSAMGELSHQTDDFFELLSPLLEEDAAPACTELPPQEAQDVLSLLIEENARLRALAVTLSNLLGDLPVRDWKQAMAAARPTLRLAGDAAPARPTSLPSASASP
jgi:hypothetical protein